jgi:two-component system CheB/CheR fusion protein
VDSSPGAGTTVRVTIDPGDLGGIPRITADDSPGSTPDPLLDPTAEHAVELPEGLRVLLAEDTVSNQRLIGRILGQEGVSLDVVNDGMEAVDAVERSEARGLSYHVILMDMLMPNLGGLDAAARLRALGCRTPIVALTANVMEGDRERYLRSGCDAYLGKPIDRLELLATLSRLGPHRSKVAGPFPPSGQHS